MCDDGGDTMYFMGAKHARDEYRALVIKARALVDMLDDAERNHGALIGGKTLRAANELRLELEPFKAVK